MVGKIVVILRGIRSLKMSSKKNGKEIFKEGFYKFLLFIFITNVIALVILAMLKINPPTLAFGISDTTAQAYLISLVESSVVIVICGLLFSFAHRRAKRKKSVK